MGIKPEGTAREENFILDHEKWRAKLGNLSFVLVGLMHVDSIHGPWAHLEA